MENQLLKNENKIKSRNVILLIIITFVLIALSLMLIYYLRLRSRNLKQQKILNEVKLAQKEQEKKHLQDNIFAEKQINRLQKEKFDSEMALKNKQLMSSMACLVNKNEVLGKLKAEIKASGSTFEQKKEIIHFININTDIDTDWKKFRIDFEEVHPGFFDRLRKSFPELTESYQKLCALLRIGLSSQEIADTLFVSLATVNKNRQRLRKKLNLAPESDLTHFLETI
jgi:ATP/maltotriose-dependent transcriptional regulator MalT